ncbi:hypothetical protein BS78_K289700 [Paspalum vaginatum]|uniref:BAHD acyltransferase n=1 Tax=Paspalum vaginatum TaxID=158149 RepID=A0A9W7X9Z3_9POAL|nr:hypothetical protein BS78_K289700 [Paspalum vaginatum]
MAAAPGVRMLSVSRVTPAPAPAANEKAVKLSFLDAPWVATPPVQEVMFYEKAGGGEEFAAVVKRLKESLAAALALYLPLAGEMAYVEETRDMVVDCSRPGVPFFEAEAIAGCGGAVDIASLLPEHDGRALPTPVLAVQATRLNGAGLVLGVSVLHAVADGRAFFLFMDAWSSISRGGSPPVPKPLAPLVYAREAIAHPYGDKLARHVLSKVAAAPANLPLPIQQASNVKPGRLGRETFVLGADDIWALKRRIDGLAPSANNTKPVSAFVALSALSWTAFVRAKGLAAGEDTHLLFQVDLRARLRPAVSAGYIGNCVRGCVASADAGELVGEEGLLRAARAIQAAVGEVVAAPMAGIGTWIQRVMALPAARVANVGGSPMFRMHQLADFGFGMPDMVVPVYMPGSPETTPGRVDDMTTEHGGRIVLSAGNQDGEVHVSVSLCPELIDAFKNHINSTTIRSRF